MKMLRFARTDRQGGTVRRRLGGGRHFFWSAVTALLLAACHKTPPPQPTVASVEASRDGATITRATKAQPITRSQRLEVGSEVTTPAGVRASLYLDAGAWVLLDQGSSLTVLD